MSARRRVTVLGGSSAFVPALAAALADASPSLPPLELALVGRRRPATECVARFCTLHARARDVDLRATAFVDVAAGAEGAAALVLSARVGGWAARRHDDTFPLAADLPGDETIGPGGLASALRTVPVVRDLVGRASRVAPDAPVIVMTNPLGIVTRALAALPDVAAFGLCELPPATLSQACALLDVDPAAVDARYVGCNHQGGFSSLRHDGRELLPRLFDAVAALPAGSPFGVDAEAMRRLGALPLKYLELYLHTERVVARQRSRTSRGEQLGELAETLLAAYAGSSDGRLPRALAERRMPWWSEALVPCLVALLGGPPARLALTRGSDGREQLTELDAAGPRWQPPTDAHTPSALTRLVEGVQRYEGLALEACERPDAEHVARALAAHPLGLRAEQVRALVPAVLAVPLHAWGA